MNCSRREDTGGGDVGIGIVSRLVSTGGISCSSGSSRAFGGSIAPPSDGFELILSISFGFTTGFFMEDVKADID